MCCHEVFQNVHTFTEVGFYRKFDGSTGCISHQTTHTGKLFDLLFGTTGTGVSHHLDVVISIQTSHQFFCQTIIGFVPCINNTTVTFFFCITSTVKFSCDLVNLCLCFIQHSLLGIRNDNIGNGYGNSSLCGIMVTQVFYIIQNFSSLGCAMQVNYFFKDRF